MYLRFTDPILFWFTVRFTDSVFTSGFFQSLPGWVNRELTARFIFEFTESLLTWLIASTPQQDFDVQTPFSGRRHVPC